MKDTTNLLKNIIAANGNKFFNVTFIKKNGELRSINGHCRYVAGHDGENPIAHKGNYVTVVLSAKDAKGNAQFRNVNCDTIQTLSIDGQKLFFK